MGFVNLIFEYITDLVKEVYLYITNFRHQYFNEGFDSIFYNN